MDKIRLLQTITHKKITLPFYHTIAERPLPHIKHLYRMKTVSEFLCDLDFLLMYYDPIDVETLYDLHINGITPKKPVFHLTFDDGLKEIYEIVAPILLEKGVPATFFINSGFVDNKALFYRYQVSLAIENLLQEGLLTNSLKQEILSYSCNDKEKIFQYYSELQIRDFLEKEKPYLTTEQIQTLSKQGFSIGAHSIDHPYYYQIPLEEQVRQTVESVNYISSVITQKLKLFAFPFTDFNVSKQFFRKIKPFVDLSFGTANLKRDEINFNIQRIPAEGSTYIPLKKIIQNHYLKYLIKGCINRNFIKRI